MSEEFEAIFDRLKAILAKYADGLDASQNDRGEFGLAGPVGPATLAAWRGKMKHPKVAVAWVRAGKAYVSYHLMGLYMNPKLAAQVPVELRVRMQGKTCFNFKSLDESLISKLETLTERSIAALRMGCFVVDS